MAGWYLQIHGCPYRFGTGGVTSAPTSADADFTSQPTYVAGALVPPEQGWTETVNPLTGELDVSGMTFRLLDPVATEGEAAGYPVISWLASRSASELVSTPLTATLLSTTGTGSSFSVADIDTFATPCVAYVDQEAIYCDGVADGDLQIGTDGRGYYGSLAVTHAVDSSTDLAPEAFTTFPGFARRRVTFWRVDELGRATLWWIGYCQRAPRQVPGTLQWELQCDHAWTVERQRSLGPVTFTCCLRGYDVGAINLTITKDNDPPVLAAATITDPRVYDTLQLALQEVQKRFHDAWVVRFGSATDWNAQFVVTGNAVDFTIVIASLTNFFAVFQFGTKQAVSAPSNTSGNRFAHGRMEDLPPALVLVSVGYSNDLHVDDASGLPASASIFTDTTSDAPHWTTAQQLLFGEYDDERIFLLLLTGSDPVARTATGIPLLLPKTPAAPTASPAYWLLERAVQLRLCVRVRGSHWVYVLRRGVIEDSTVVAAGLHSRNWEWSQAARLAGLTTADTSEVEWLLDGTTTLEQLVGDLCKLGTCAIGIREGRLSPFALQPPLSTDTPVATLGQSDFVKYQAPEWSLSPELLVNCAELESASVHVVVSDRRSVARYGPTRAASVQLHSGGMPRAAESPEALRRLLGRYLGTWADPVRQVTVHVSLAQAAEIFHGDYITLTEARLPSGRGGRGASSLTVQVVGKDVVLSKEGFVRLRCLDYDRPRLAGYAPCVRAESIADDTLTAAADYVYGSGAGTAEYSGSAGRGVGDFRAGDRVQLIERDNASPHSVESLVILSVDSAAHTVTFATSPSTDWQDIIDADGTVDLRYDLYSTSGLQDGQKDYGWVADEITETIDGSSDPAKRWSP